MSGRPVLIGERLNSNKECEEPLWPLDKGSGQRLFEMAGMGLMRYLDAFERTNATDVIIDELRFRTAIVLGRRAWKLIDLPSVDWFDETHRYLVTWILIPHPSGRNRLYNEPFNRWRVRRLLRLVSIDDQARETVDHPAY